MKSGFLTSRDGKAWAPHEAADRDQTPRYAQDRPAELDHAAADRGAQAERERDFAFAYLMSAVKALLFDDSPLVAGREKYRIAEHHFTKWLAFKEPRA